MAWHAPQAENMDYKSKLQPQNEQSEAGWQPTFEAELEALRAEFSAEDRQRMASYVGTTVEPTFRNPASVILPATLRDFLAWAKGRDFINDEREWSPVFTPRQIREYMVEYGLPLAHPSKIPIGMDGGGCFYVVDLAGDSLPTYLLDPGDPRNSCGLLADSLSAALMDGRSQIEVAGL